MTSYERRPMLTPQPRRRSPEERPAPTPGPARRFLGWEETAAMLEVSLLTLRRWSAKGYGVQPMLRPEGRLFRAEEIERLAAMPKDRRMFAITRANRLTSRVRPR